MAGDISAGLTSTALKESGGNFSSSAGVVNESHRIAALLPLADFFVLALSMVLAIQARVSIPLFAPDSQVASTVAPLSTLILALWLGALWMYGAYHPQQLDSGMRDFRRVFEASLLTSAAVGISAYLFGYPLSRGFFLMFFLVGTPALIASRWVMRTAIRSMRRRGHMHTGVLIAGDERHILDLHQVVDRETWLGFDVVGLLPNDGISEPSLKHIPVLGAPSDCLDAVRASGASLVIFTEGSFDRAAQFSLLARDLEDESAQLVVVPALTDISAQRMTARMLAGVPLVFIEKPTTREARAWLKRAFDVVGATLLLLAGLPVLLLTAIAIKLDDGGPIIFRQARVGYHRKTFWCLKFRSMVTDADSMLVDLADKNQSDGVLFKMRADPRITRVGRLIRRYSIDELPQLFNVLKGEMSLVGPRPALEKEVSKYENHVTRRLAVTPGLTGLWQVSGRSDLSWEDTVRLDLYYVDNWTFAQDMAILARTFMAVLRKNGAY